MSIESNQLLLLLNWMSPAFPIGGFSYSHGLEWEIEQGHVSLAAELQDWIEQLIRCGSGWNDAVIFSQCWNDDPARLNQLALALAGSSERYLETSNLGAAFRQASAAWAIESMLKSETIAYPVAAGTACRAAGIARLHGLLAFLQGFSNALISVAVKLVPLGQTHGMVTARNLMPVISETAKRASEATLDDLGSMCLAAEISAMKHETLQSRIFRT